MTSAGAPARKKGRDRAVTPRRRRFFELQSLVGVVLGLTLYVICFSGLAALLADYLPAWEDPDLRSPRVGQAFDPHAVVETLRRQAPEIWSRIPGNQNPDSAEDSRVFLFAPTDSLPLTQVRWLDPQLERQRVFYVDPRDHKVVKEPVLGFRHVMVRLHTDFLLPRPWGRYWVAGLGLIFLSALVAGLLFHRKELFKAFGMSTGIFLHRGPERRLIGAWGLVFQLMIFCTGAFVALLGIFLSIGAVNAYHGDRQAAMATQRAVPVPPVEIPALPLSLDELMARAAGAWPTLQPRWISLNGWQSSRRQGPSTTMTVAGTVPGLLSYGGGTGTQITLRAVDGAVVQRINWPQGNLWQRLISWMVPLHYASFGGLVLKLAYCFLGLSSALGLVTGLMLWLERRPGFLGRQHFQALERWVVGVSLGLPAAGAALLVSIRCLPAELPRPTDALTLLFLLTWLFSTLFALIAPGRREAALGLVTVTGFLLISASLLNGLLTPDAGLIAWTQGSPTVAAVDFVLISLGLSLLFVGRASVSGLPSASSRSAELPSTFRSSALSTSKFPNPPYS